MVGRVRRPGAGRKSITESDPKLVANARSIDRRANAWRPAVAAALDLQERARDCRGTDGSSTIRSATPKSPNSCRTAYSLQGNRKTEEGEDHPDRDAQFRHINRARQAAAWAGHPVISVDTKKKELIGNYQNAGSNGARAGSRSRSRT